MNITEFKNALKSGPVSFSYKKKDGTIREANGTLRKTLLPPTKAPTMKFKCSDINWDIDSNETMLTNLPSEITIELDEAYVNSINEVEDEVFYDKLQKAINDEAFDKYGFHMLEFFYSEQKKREPKKISENTVIYYDLDKKGFRSFNESQFIDVK